MRTGQLKLIRGQSDVCQKGRPLQGGTLPQSSELAGTAVATFQIGRNEVTWAEWKEVRDWAVSNGYPDLAGVGHRSDPREGFNASHRRHPTRSGKPKAHGRARVSLLLVG